MNPYPDIEKPPASAPDSVHAEYHTLCAQQLSMFMQSFQFQRLGKFMQSIIRERLQQHTRYAKRFRRKVTACAPASPAIAGTGLATSQVSAGHHSPKGKAAAYLSRFITQ